MSVDSVEFFYEPTQNLQSAITERGCLNSGVP
jgi:hypothetical protein